MAKSSKKASPKAAKKSTTKAKAKKPVKAAKKAVPAKAKKTAPKKAVKKKATKPAKKVVAKKIVKKIAPKKAVKPVAKPVAKVLSAPVTKTVAKTYGATNPLKAAPSALNIFPNTTPQRPIAHKPSANSPVSSTEGRTRYSDEELKEFESLINEKLEKARSEYKILKDTLNRNNDEGTDATSGGNTKVLEDGAETAEKENMSQLAARQQKYITNLENALVRIKNGTYGICSVTGKLISKERLMAVPHTTQSIEAKMLKQD